ncbi:hypothetical protein EYZ11_011586 [Aspergillus tanneri]|uniref:Peptidase S9 prolyl oligopeptidase catalytic domain-containing protein n=1 Tax=Aspergillus tanneri TaxID=1220188 RepID=A0A4S3J7S4_9EURO|nr:hypothetical protein EYZ11_011586 [Aspergillus tanneri]
MFLHVESDTVTPVRISGRVHEELKFLGVETELVLVPVKDHMFDMAYGSDKDEGYKEHSAAGD